MSPAKTFRIEAEQARLGVFNPRCICMLVFTACVVSGAAAIGSPAPWRKIVSAAHLDLQQEKDLSKAISIYSSAIASIEKTAPDAEARYDLYLNLAESYRKNNELEKAELILNKVGPSILNGDWVDPLLKVRYLRRRGDLYGSQSKTKESADAWLASTSLLRKYLPRSGSRELVAPLLVMNSHHDWASAARLIKQMQVFASGENSAQVLGAIEGTSSNIYVQIETLLKSSDLKGAQRLLDIVTPFAVPAEYLFNTWISFLSSCPAGYKLNEDSLSCLQNRLEKASTGSQREKAYALLLRGKLFENSFRLMEAEMEYEKACRIASQLDLESYKLCCLCLTNALSCFEQYRDASLELLRQEQRLTSPESKDYWKFAGNRNFNLHGVRIRLRLATEYARHDKIAEAEKVLVEIDKTRKQDLPDSEMKSLTPQLEICRAYKRNRESRKASQLFAILKVKASSYLKNQNQIKENPFLVRLAELVEKTEAELNDAVGAFH